jgi:hypothetical protein
MNNQPFDSSERRKFISALTSDGRLLFATRIMRLFA